jgi:peptidoglycan/LPS O-acetylase OafA/YrhL
MWGVGGFIGVDIFFTLSGFLITVLLLQERERAGSISLKGFYLRRALRLLPALIVVLVAAHLVARFCISRYEADITRRTARSIFFYYFNWRLILSPEPPHIPLLHAWSLSVEEQFYLIWPPVLAFLLWLRPRRGLILGFVVMALLASVGWRAWLWHGPDSFGRVYHCTDTRADALLIGCLVGLLTFWGLLPHKRREVFWERASLVALGVLGWYQLNSHHMTDAHLYRGGLTIISLAAGIVLVAVVQSPGSLVGRLLQKRPLVWLGKLSYGLYLWHFPIICWIAPRLFENRHFHPWSHPWRCWILEVGVSVAAAAVSYYGLERPFLRLKTRIGANREPPNAVIAETATTALRRAA